ncbi:MAG: N-formylglutamate amidohydrolase, partial [Bdellovibrionaceae bacterium]|nr:N-formylglutamate amidohydrolase [Pseudobdellovibrionaceae bacterium]
MTPFFVTIPHSGEKIPPESPWLVGLPEAVLLRDVDRFVDLLYQPALQSLKIPFVKTEWHRYAADLNRVPEDVDASSVAGNPNPPGVHNRGFHWTVPTHNEPLLT